MPQSDLFNSSACVSGWAYRRESKPLWSWFLQAAEAFPMPEADAGRLRLCIRGLAVGSTAAFVGLGVALLCCALGLLSALLLLPTAARDGSLARFRSRAGAGEHCACACRRALACGCYTARASFDHPVAQLLLALVGFVGSQVCMLALPLTLEHAAHVIAPLATRPVQSSVRFRPGFALLVLGAVCCFLPFVVALAAQYVLADVVGDPFRRVTPLRCPVRFPCCGGCGSARGGAYAGKSAAPSADRGSSLHPSGSSGIELRRSVRERGAADGERERAAASAALSSALEDALRLAEADGDQSPATPKRRGAGGEAYAESPAVGGEERRLLSESPAPASALKPPAIGKPSAIEKPPVVVHNPVAGAPSVVLSTRELHAADGPRKANEPVPSGGATHVRAAAARFGAKAGSAAAGGGPVAAVSTKNPFASLTAAAPLPANSLSGPSASDRSGTPASDSRLAEKAASTNPFAGLP